MLLRRVPAPPLRPFVELLWTGDFASGPETWRERALPTGRDDLVFRLEGGPVRVFADPHDARGETYEPAVVSGARAHAFVRDVSQRSVSVGAHFRPGGAALLLSVRGGELAGRHTSLGDLWGAGAACAYERLAAAPTPAARLEELERILLARLPARALHPAVTHLVARIDASHGRAPMRALVAETGFGQRWVGEAFRRSVGFAPKVYARVRRFQHALQLAADRRAGGWLEVALRAGFSDPSHLVREFQALAGIPPSAYRPLASDRASHVPIPAGTSIPSKRAAEIRGTRGS